MTASRELKYELHLEITSRCALKCPLCPRTEFSENFSVTDMSMEMIKNITSTQQEFDNVALCGNHGDPIYHKDLFQILEHLKSLPGSPRIQINTNGSYKKESWWKELGSLLRKQDRVVFGVDGLEDTSRLYRVNGDWNSVWEGIATLKKHSCCQMRWQWILFRYNEHQLGRARELCEEFDIDDFSIIKSSRHLDKINEQPTITLDEARRRFMEGL